MRWRERETLRKGESRWRKRAFSLKGQAKPATTPTNNSTEDTSLERGCSGCRSRRGRVVVVVVLHSRNKNFKGKKGSSRRAEKMEAADSGCVDSATRKRERGEAGR